MFKIESAGNGMFKKFVSLGTRKGRLAHGAFLVEGERVVAEIPQGWPVECFLFSETWAAGKNLAPYEARGPVCVLADRLAARVSGLVTPPGALAVCPIPAPDPRGAFRGPQPLVLVADQLADPGNLGALLRTAAALGCTGALLSEGCADVYGPKVLRAMSGALFRLPLAWGLRAEEIARLCREAGAALIAAHLAEAPPPWALNLRGPCALALGNEAHGLSPALARHATACTRIPMPGGFDSLNAATAGGMLLYEALRQRESSE